jgi:hypothetical protein
MMKKRTKLPENVGVVMTHSRFVQCSNVCPRPFIQVSRCLLSSSKQMPLEWYLKICHERSRRLYNRGHIISEVLKRP